MAKQHRYVCGECGCGTNKARPYKETILCNYCHGVKMGDIIPPKPMSYWDRQRKVREQMAMDGQDYIIGNPAY